MGAGSAASQKEPRRARAAAMPSALQGCAAPAGLPTGGAASSTTCMCKTANAVANSYLLSYALIHHLYLVNWSLTHLLSICLPACLLACLSTICTVKYVFYHATVSMYWSCDTFAPQGLLSQEGLRSRPTALIGQAGTLWIGGTTSRKDSKHRQLKAAVPDGRFRPPHAVRITTTAGLFNAFRTDLAVLLCLGGLKGGESCCAPSKNSRWLELLSMKTSIVFAHMADGNV